MPTHPMVTRAKAGILKLLERMNCHVTTTSPLPRSYVHDLRDPNWKEAMLDEFNALITNWKEAMFMILSVKILIKEAFSLSKFSIPVVKPATIRTVLSLAVSRNWPIHQLDVKNAFLHGHLSEIVYMHQPLGFVDPNKPNYVFQLQRSLYGLKQASFVFVFSVLQMPHEDRFQHIQTDSSLFVFHRGSDIAYLLLYVDDIILTASSSAFLQRIIASLYNGFPNEGSCSLQLFRGNSTQQKSASACFLSQSKFADGNSMTSTYAKMSVIICHDPRRSALYCYKKAILRYVRGTLDYGLQLHVSYTTQLRAYTDVDWVGCPITRRSTSGYCVFLGDNLLSWSTNDQVTCLFSAEKLKIESVQMLFARHRLDQ
ncbi:ribonuclease H-like domain-containing protein [Tanacetum coccineum]